MPDIPIDYGQINWFLGGAGLPTGAEVTCGFRDDGPVDPAVAAAAALAAFSGNIMLHMAGQVQLQKCRVKLGPDATGPFAEASGITNGGGAVSATSPNVSFLIHKRTAFGGRAGAGRMYLPGVQEDGVDAAGVILGSVVTAMTSAVEDLAADLVTAGMTPVVLHGAGSPLVTPSVITSWSCDARAATQRRRLRR